MRTDKILDEIEDWLFEAPKHPMVQYATSYNSDGHMTGIMPIAVDTWNAEAMMIEWHALRRRLER